MSPLPFPFQGRGPFVHGEKGEKVSVSLAVGLPRAAEAAWVRTRPRVWERCGR